MANNIHHKVRCNSFSFGLKLFSIFLITLFIVPLSASSGKNRSLIPTWTSKELQFNVGSSKIVETPFDIKEIFIVDPKVVDVKSINKRSFYVLSSQIGETQVYASTNDKSQWLKVKLKITYDIEKLSQLIKKVAPGNNVEITPVPNGLMLSGSLNSTEAAYRIDALARQLLGEKGALINNLSVKTSAQINLGVKVAEVQHTTVSQLESNLSGSIRNGHITYGLSNTLNNPTHSIQYQDGTTNILQSLNMLVRDNLATILAEPNLLASSGKPASFNVGGEIPYPIPQSGTNTVTIEYKKYGIILTFTPTIIGKMIHLKLETEVSEPNKALGVQLNGYEIPALTTKKASTDVMLQNGQSLMIAGLIYDSIQTGSSGTPGLSEIPLIGALFRSDTSSREKRELVIIVTPNCVEPVQAAKDMKLPTSGMQFVNMVDRLVTGDMARKEDDTSPSSRLPSKFSENAGFYYE